MSTKPGSPKRPSPQLYEHIHRTIVLHELRLRRILRADHPHDDARLVNFDERMLEIFERTVDRRMEERPQERLAYLT